MSHNENAGIDLARLALRRARAGASKRPAGAAKAPAASYSAGPLNQAHGETILRGIRVARAYGARSAEEPHWASRYSGVAQVAKTKARADASPGYLRALAQQQASRPSSPADSRTSPAVDQRIRTLARETVLRLSGQRPG
ncbi:hypothetical protein [Streptomyces sp. CBMA123]|uniref:hypothetical protein n=1 Tax=Streptomyces sp. CBMA123 TaxID=1896313 RepID=UPI001661965F|nr:hypothetical protein [Streptomyces sp. CBMA123]MBD0688345.1 hypothetical protein [Streptomyces sp. CBMA123]